MDLSLFQLQETVTTQRTLIQEQAHLLRWTLRELERAGARDSRAYAEIQRHLTRERL